MAKTTSWIFGVIFVIAGIWGLVHAPAVGFIAGNMLANIVHLVVGLVLLAMAGKASAGCTLKTVGIIYVVWALLGFFGWGTFTGVDGVTSWFYVVVGLILAAIGFASKGSMASSVPPSTPTAPAQM